jgi:hypothetical protein
LRIELNVDAVLTGRLRTVAQTVLLDAELVNATDGTTLWGKRYVRKLTDIVVLEQQIARDLCEEVRLGLAPRRSREPDPRAYEAYLAERSSSKKERRLRCTRALCISSRPSSSIRSMRCHTPSSR